MGRKIMVKLFTNRLSHLCSTHKVLRGYNFAALKGSSTSTPIHTINNVLEDAREHNKEIWIAFQDMAKAFDSVGLLPLRRALQRIKIPEPAINFILDLFDQRNIKIITAHGLSAGFTAQDGIDQGEVISPLLWRIFYDPLLCNIQKNEAWGYELTLPEFSKRHQFHEPAVRIATSAFADDTIWVGKSKSELQSIIQRSDSFFKLNDIEINGAKSELLVINPSDKNKSSHAITKIGRASCRERV